MSTRQERVRSFILMTGVFVAALGLTMPGALTAGGGGGGDCIDYWVDTCVSETQDCVDCESYCLGVSDVLEKSCPVEWAYCNEDEYCEEVPNRPVHTECACGAGDGGGGDPD